MHNSLLTFVYTTSVDGVTDGEVGDVGVAVGEVGVVVGEVGVAGVETAGVFGDIDVGVTVSDGRSIEVFVGRGDKTIGIETLDINTNMNISANEPIRTLGFTRLLRPIRMNAQPTIPNAAIPKAMTIRTRYNM